jgi:hypothetical protein
MRGRAGSGRRLPLLAGGLRQRVAGGLLLAGLVFAGVVRAQEVPAGLVVHAGEREVVVRWEPAAGATSYRLYRAVGEEAPALLAETPRTVLVDRRLEGGTTYTYAVAAVGSEVEGLASAEVQATPGPLSDEAFLLLVQRLSFDYFWYEAHPETGLVPDRTAPGSASSIAAVGFGLTALTVGVARGYISREAAAERTLRTLRTLWEAPMGPEASGTAGYRGMFYHFLEMGTGLRAGTSEVSTIDTALLMAGVLDVGAFFDGEGAEEAEIRALSRQLYERVDWAWSQVRPPLIGHGWRPESGHIPFDYGGYSEAMLLYLLALGSPTHPVGPSAWGSWTAGYQWATYYGLSFVTFPPLFGHQYTHAWVDFRGIRDSYMRTRGIDYFENSRRAALAQRAYAIANPLGHPNYGPNEWGLTASDGPDGYRARGVPPVLNDDGTIAPTAAGGSIAFVPEEATAALRQMYARYPNNLWGEYGFRDAYNIRRVWFASDYLGIDQGPFVLMIENLLSESIWERFNAIPAVQRGLERAGFQPVSTSTDPGATPPALGLALFPNPASGAVTLTLRGAPPEGVMLVVFDLLGREVARVRVAEGEPVMVPVGGWASGLYIARAEASGAVVRVPFTVLRE